MNRRVKWILLFFLLFLQIFENKFLSDTWISFDFSYLILVFVALKSDIIKTGLVATLLGLMLDFLSGGVPGVFGFSRTLVAFITREILTFIDLKKNFYVFIIISGSLSVSNLIVNFLLYLIFGFAINISFVLYQPILTGITAYLILKNSYLKKQLDVY